MILNTVPLLKIFQPNFHTQDHFFSRTRARSTGLSKMAARTFCRMGSLTRNLLPLNKGELSILFSIKLNTINTFTQFRYILPEPSTYNFLFPVRGLNEVHNTIYTRCYPSAQHNLRGGFCLSILYTHILPYIKLIYI